MKSLENYLTNQSLEKDVDVLCDPQLDFEKHRGQVNDLVMNTVIKYIALYMNVPPDISEIKKALEKEFKEIRRIRGNGAYSLMTHKNPDIKGRHASVHAFPFECLVDIRSTGAVFKEIAGNDGFSTDGAFRGLDFGTGTAILALAIAIAAKRKEISDILVVGVDVRELAVINARQALEKILGDEVKIIEGDLMKRGVLKKVLKKYPPTYWVSETISDNTPPLILNLFNLGVIDKYHSEIERVNDPLVGLLSGTVQHDPEFFNKVLRREIAMFPDPVHNLYRPNKLKSTLTLKTGSGKPLLLDRVGEEFEDYEDLEVNQKRWKVGK